MYSASTVFHIIFKIFWKILSYDYHDPQSLTMILASIPWHPMASHGMAAGKQLSDSKGASAAISTEAAVLSVRRVGRLNRSGGCFYGNYSQRRRWKLATHT